MINEKTAAGYRILLGPGLNEKELIFAVETAQLIGFWQISCEFPVVTKTADDPDCRYLVFGNPGQVPGNSIPVHANEDVEQEWRRLFHILKHFPGNGIDAPEGFISAAPKKALLQHIPSDPFLSHASIEFAEKITEDTACAACDLAVRIGMEKDAITWPLVGSGEKNKILFTSTPGEPFISFPEEGRMEVSGCGADLRTFMSAVCNQFSGTGTGTAFSRFLIDSEEKLTRYSEKKPYSDISMELPVISDLQLCESILNDKLWPAVQRGDSVRLSAAVWKSHETRRDFAEALQKKAETYGVSLQTEILCVYKEGLSWVIDSVLPEICALEQFDRIILSFQPSAVSSWMEGDAPESLKAGQPPRWLKNLYPADMMLAEALGIQPEQISFEALPETAENTVEARVLDRQGCTVLSVGHVIPVRVHPYIELFPAYGTVITETGYLDVSLNGKTVIHTTLASDGEQVMRQYQEKILPQAMKLAESFGYQSSAQPFFRRIDMEVKIDGWEQELNFDSEHISSGEMLEDALHQTGHDLFMFYGRREHKESLDSPGLFLAHIHTTKDKPEFRAKFHAPVIRTAESSLKLKFTGLRAVDENILPVIETMPLQPEEEETVIRCLDEIPGVILNGKLLCRKASPITEEAALSELRNLNTDGLFDYERYSEVVSVLKAHPSFDVWKAAESWEGRPVWCICPKRADRGFVSCHKRFELLPTVLVNGRHHANEISATNAEFRLIQAIADGGLWQNIIQKVNVLFVPVENADGVALHGKMAKEHPTWQHHSAYTNATGADLMPNYYVPDTIHTGALAFQHIFRDFMPDAMIDLHGVPTHEISAEYCPVGGYEGLWIPRAVLCSFYFHIHDIGYEGNEAYTRAWKEYISRSYEGLEWFEKKSNELNCRFMKYTWNGADQTYSSSLDGAMLNYWIPSPYNPSHPYPTVCWPWCCTMMFTAEAADETATGEWLNHCAEAHRIHVAAGVRLMAESDAAFEITEQGTDITGYTVRRRRPLIAPSERDTQ